MSTINTTNTTVLYCWNGLCTTQPAHCRTANKIMRCSDNKEGGRGCGRGGGYESVVVEGWGLTCGEGERAGRWVEGGGRGVE